MNGDAAPTWATALIESMTTRFDRTDAKLDAKLDAIEDRLDRIADKMEKAADDLEQAHATLDRIITQVTGRAPPRRGE